MAAKNSGAGTPREFVSAAAALLGIKYAEMAGEARERHIVQARWAVAYALRKSRGMSSTAIGKHLGNRDHTTILYGLRQADALIEADGNFAAICAALLDMAESRWRCDAE